MAICSSSCTPAQPSDVAEAETPPPAQKVHQTPSKEDEQAHYEVLSRHDTNATFSGMRDHICMGRSMLCPDQCGHSGTLAVFKIKNYNAYEKLSKYGDPKTEEFVVMLKSKNGESTLSDDLIRKISALNVGDEVHLAWEHIYVTDSHGSQFPERKIRIVEKLPTP